MTFAAIWLQHLINHDDNRSSLHRQRPSTQQRQPPTHDHNCFMTASSRQPLSPRASPQLLVNFTFHPNNRKPGPVTPSAAVFAEPFNSENERSAMSDDTRHFRSTFVSTQPVITSSSHPGHR